MRGLKTFRSGRTPRGQPRIRAEPRRCHYDIATDLAARHLLRAAFDELAQVVGQRARPPFTYQLADQWHNATVPLALHRRQSSSFEGGVSELLERVRLPAS
ncbi:MAG: hypothetical protein WKF73_09880 [Nocardioidaceae bacterium]